MPNTQTTQATMMQERRRRTGQIMLGAAAVNAVLLTALAQQAHQTVLALAVALPCLALATYNFFFVRGPHASGLGYSLALITLVLAQIQVTHGRPELHFNLFVSLSLLALFRRWWVIASAGALIAVHHVVFDRLLSAGYAVYVLPEPSLPLIGVHLAFVAVQCIYLASLAYSQERAEREQFEIDFLVRAMGSDGPIRLNLNVLRADSAIGVRLKDVQQRMAAAIAQVSASTQGVRHAAEGLDADGTELRARTDNTASGLRDAAVCLDQINLIVQTSAKASTEARTMSAEASRLAGEGGELVSQVVSTMNEIDKSSRKITDIIGVIDGIAFQTNILALNAAVEAARAGEQGRGFAVVASEVRTLALRSSEAAREIKTLIGASLETVENGTRLVNEAGKTMVGLVDSVKRVGQAFDNLSADSHENAAGIDVVTQSVKDLNDITQQNIAVAERSCKVSAELRGHAESLQAVLSAFNLGDTAVNPAASAPAAVARTTVVVPTARKAERRSQPEAALAASAAASNIEYF